MYCHKHDEHYDSDLQTDCSGCDEETTECEICEGTGEVAVDEFDPDSGRYMAGVGTQKCICRIEQD